MPNWASQAELASCNTLGSVKTCPAAPVSIDLAGCESLAPLLVILKPPRLRAARARCRTSAADPKQRLGSFARPQWSRLSAAAMEASVAPGEIVEAIVTGEVELVRAWLDNGGDANAKCGVSGYGLRDPAMLLIVAARCGKTRIMDLLLTRGADIDATDADGRTAVYELLNYWVTHGSLPALKMLLSHGADVNKTKQSGFLVGQTPLMIAISFGPDVVRMLLRAGADPEHRAHDLGLANSTAEEQARSDPYSQRSESADSARSTLARVISQLACNQ